MLHNFAVFLFGLLLRLCLTLVVVGVNGILLYAVLPNHPHEHVPIVGRAVILITS